MSIKQQYKMPSNPYTKTSHFSLRRDNLYISLENSPSHVQNLCNQTYSSEALEVKWLIHTFNEIFKVKNTILVRGESEPEYFPSTPATPARITFAYGFLSSALHEISHWTIAGAHRRTLLDFGYWYAPDGRTEKQQQAFEFFEIRPQAIECLFTLMLNKPFNTSKDNLHADFDISNITFENNVLQQVDNYIKAPKTLPVDSMILLTALAHLCHDINPTS